MIQGQKNLPPNLLRFLSQDMILNLLNSNGVGKTPQLHFLQVVYVTYPVLAVLFFTTLLASIALVILASLKPLVWQRQARRIWRAFAVWLVLYSLFIGFFTGPKDVSSYPPQSSSPYKLPWKSGVSRFVAQGNRSFTSHRDFQEYAWDFVMPNGTEILAARDGRVLEIQDRFNGIGLKSNFLILEHEDGERSAYAHIRKAGALVKIGDQVKQGQPIALSGMVGQTIFPHVHFYVINRDGTSSVPISFREVSGGVPMAGHFYTSENSTN